MSESTLKNMKCRLRALLPVYLKKLSHKVDMFQIVIYIEQL